jgi:predicted transcriptional regulator
VAVNIVNPGPDHGLAPGSSELTRTEGRDVIPSQALTAPGLGITIVLLDTGESRMRVTSLKLPEKLKERVAEVVADSDKSAHAFMIEAIERQTALAEARKRFINDALAAEQTMLRSGKGYRAEEVHRYMLAKASGKQSVRPKAKTWR